MAHNINHYQGTGIRYKGTEGIKKQKRCGKERIKERKNERKRGVIERSQIRGGPNYTK